MIEFYRLQNIKSLTRGGDNDGFFEDVGYLSRRYRYVLGAYGSRFLNSQFRRPDNTDTSQPNMHTNRTVGALLKPGPTGKPVSPLGTPIWSDLILHKQGVSPDDGVQLTNCVITVSQTKSMVTTKIVAGKQGSSPNPTPTPSTSPNSSQNPSQKYQSYNQSQNPSPPAVRSNVKEDEYVVTLTGSVVRTFKNEYPLDEVGRLIALLKYGQPLQAVSPYLRQFKIHELLIENYIINQETGKQNSQNFTIKAYSNKP